jgi:hypothetical protein
MSLWCRSIINLKSVSVRFGIANFYKEYINKKIYFLRDIL